MKKELIKKFNDGVGLTDEECFELYIFFKIMEGSLDLMGERYHLAWFPIMMNRRTVEKYIEMRGLPLPKDATVVYRDEKLSGVKG